MSNPDGNPSSRSSNFPLQVIVWSVALYIGAQMLADVASLKIGAVFTWAVDMGTFIYPVTFTLRDLAHRALGRKAVRHLVIAAAAVNGIMIAYLAGAAAVDVPNEEGLAAAHDAFRTLFLSPGLTRIVLASIAAEIVSELVDTEVYHWFVTRVTRRHRWARVLVSNSAAVPVDNAIFAVGAFGWAMPWAVVGQIFMFNLAVKYIMTVLSIPLIYLTPAAIDRD